MALLRFRPTEPVTPQPLSPETAQLFLDRYQDPRHESWCMATARDVDWGRVAQWLSLSYQQRRLFFRYYQCDDPLAHFVLKPPPPATLDVIMTLTPDTAPALARRLNIYPLQDKYQYLVDSLTDLEPDTNGYVNVYPHRAAYQRARSAKHVLVVVNGQYRVRGGGNQMSLDDYMSWLIIARTRNTLNVGDLFFYHCLLASRVVDVVITLHHNDRPFASLPPATAREVAVNLQAGRVTDVVMDASMTYFGLPAPDPTEIRWLAVALLGL